jgi:prepilin-type N-terminal cleavage/methylation domain-containing protein
MNCGISSTRLKSLSGNFRRRLLAFTLIELLLVITIIGILAALGLPHLKGWGAGNSMASATRQLMDDLSAARQKAISSRSRVYVVFISPEVVDRAFFNGLSAEEKTNRTRLFSGQFTTYALYSKRQVGDQPGPERNAHYITSWKTLPEKIFIATNKFTPMIEANRLLIADATKRPFATNSFPFPTATNSALNLPYLEFDPSGRLISEQSSTGQNSEAVIPLTHGSIFYARDANGNLTLGDADVVETPAQNSVSNRNEIHIDWLTGRSRVVREEFK